MSERGIEKKSVKRRILDYIVITIASLIYAIGISLFLDPNNLAPGGVTGIAIILNRLIPVATGTLVILLNIPILVIGLWKFGFRFLVSTIYATMISSVFINLLDPLEPITKDPMLAAIIGGAFCAIALGFIFRADATTGGTDIVVKLLRLRFQHLKTGRLFFLTDVFIVSLSGFVFGNIDTVFYALISVMIMSVLFDAVLYGTDGAKLIYIISDHPQEIADRILAELDVGITFLSGVGAYSSKEKRVIMCVMRKQISPKAEEIVKEEDPAAFMIVSSAAEIYGEGYKNIFSKKL